MRSMNKKKTIAALFVVGSISFLSCLFTQSSYLEETEKTTQLCRSVSASKDNGKYNLWGRLRRLGLCGTLSFLGTAVEQEVYDCLKDIGL